MDIVASDLAVLPAELIEDVVEAYVRFQYLTQMSDNWQQWEVQKRLTTDADAQRTLTGLIDASIVGYETTMGAALNSAARAILTLCPIVHRRPAPVKTPEEYLKYVEDKTEVKDAEVTPLDQPPPTDAPPGTT